MRPLWTMAIPFLATRVGNTQSNMSMPLATPSTEGVRRSYAHEVSCFICRKPLRRVFEDIVHDVMRLAYRKSADGYAVKGHGEISSALLFLKSLYMPPCTMPNMPRSSLVCALMHLSAQRVVLAVDWSAYL